MSDFFSLQKITDILPFFITKGYDVGFYDLLDIFLLTALLYRVFLFIKETRSLQILFGLFLLLFVYALSDLLQLTATYTTLNLLFGSIVLIMVVLFQNDIRQMLATLGRKKIHFKRSKLQDIYFYDRLLRAVEYCTSNQTGMLIAIEKKHSLRSYAYSGTVLDARLSAPLLVSIFKQDSPLHDGAVLIDRNLRLYAAACILPLTSRINLSNKMGTRHRAAIGLSEECDCLILVVSEETGALSFFCDGQQEIVQLEHFKEKIDTMLFPPVREKGYANALRSS